MGRSALYLAAGLFLVVLAQAAEPLRWTDPQGKNHFFEMVTSDVPVGFNTARRAAAGMRYQGMSGHLATITSDAEDYFLTSFFPAQMGQKYADASKRNAWIGYVRDGAGFKWVTGEVGEVPAFCANEPNNGSGQENQVHVFCHAFDQWCWNDIDETNDYVHAYIVEYDGLADEMFAGAPAGGRRAPPAFPGSAATPPPPPPPPQQYQPPPQQNNYQQPPPQQQQESVFTPEKKLLLETKLGLGPNGQDQHVIKTYEGEDPYQVANDFAAKHGLDAGSAQKLGDHIVEELKHVTANDVANKQAMQPPSSSGPSQTPRAMQIDEATRAQFASCLTACIGGITDDDAYDVTPIVNCSKKCSNGLI